MNDRSTRRKILAAGAACAGGLAGIWRAGRLRADDKKAPAATEPLYKISLGEYSLHRALDALQHCELHLAHSLAVSRT